MEVVIINTVITALIAIIVIIIKIILVTMLSIVTQYKYQTAIPNISGRYHIRLAVFTVFYW